MTELLEIADALYALAPGEFTTARDARVRELKADKELAAQVKALRKPAMAAWVVNQLVRREQESVGQLLAVGAALREAAAALDASDLRELTKQRRQVTAAVTTQARRVSRELGVKVTEAVAEQVEQMLTAAMLDERAAAAVRSGLLTSPFTPATADTVSESVALPDALGFSPAAIAEEVPGPPTLTVLRGEKERTEAEEELAAAEEAWQRAREAAAAAAAAVEGLEAESLRVGARVDEARRRLAEAEEAADEVASRLTDAVDEREEAAQDEEEAARRRTAAAERLAALDG